MNQELFDSVTELIKNPKAYPAFPGTANNSYKCKHCQHICRVSGGSKIYIKCGILEHRWTNGVGTDIKANSPACSFFQLN